MHASTSIRTTPCAREYMYTCHILATTGRFGASSVAVSEVLQGQQQVTVAEGEADNDCYSSFGNVVCDRWVLRAHTAAHDVAMTLRNSGIDACTYMYLCRAPLDHIDVCTPQCRTHSHSNSRESWLKISNNVHVLYRKCLFIVCTGVNGSYTLFLLPFYHVLLIIHMVLYIS